MVYELSENDSNVVTDTFGIIWRTFFPINWHRAGDLAIAAQEPSFGEPLRQQPCRLGQVH